MYRSNLDVNGVADDFSSYHSLGGLNMLGLQDSMCLDTSGSLGSPNLPMAPPSVSSATMSPPTTPLTPEPSPFSTQFPLLTDNNNINASMLGAALNAGVQSSTAASSSNLQTQLLLQRQYQYHLLLQQQQQQLALAKQQLALAASAAAVQHQGKDEIANSLKMFALLTACNADNGNYSLQDIMQEFAANGQVSDDLTRLQYCNPNATLLQAAPQAATAPPMPTQRHLHAGAATATTPPITASQWLNLNSYREQLNNVWRNITYYNLPNATAINASLAAATAINNNAVSNNLGLSVNMPLEQMRTSSNNKQYKRHANLKPKENARRCVFCENNNEPNAVVSSHSVRDSLGRVLCPKLRTYVCPICKASGDSAHTIKYCPKKPIITMEDAIKAESFRLAKSAYFKQQMKV